MVGRFAMGFKPAAIADKGAAGQAGSQANAKTVSGIVHLSTPKAVCRRHLDMQFDHILIV